MWYFGTCTFIEAYFAGLKQKNVALVICGFGSGSLVLRGRWVSLAGFG
jgi:hypothetical protein